MTALRNHAARAGLACRDSVRSHDFRWRFALFGVMKTLGLALALVGITTGGGCKRNNNSLAGPATAPSQGKPPVKVYTDDGLPKLEMTPSRQFFNAMVFRDVDTVRKILAEHPELARTPTNGTTPIAIAVSSRMVPLAQAIIERKPDMSVKTDEGWSMAWLAVESDSIPVVKYLIEQGVDVKARERDGETLLWTASSREMAEFLIKAGVDPKARDKANDTALHAACRYSRKEVVELLLDSGLKVDERGHWNMLPIHSAASSPIGDARPLVNYLITQKQADVNAKGFNGHTALHEAAFYNRLDMADLLLSLDAEVDAKDNDKKTPMELAILAGKKDRLRLINLLIKHGAIDPKTGKVGILEPLPKPGDEE